MSHPHEITVREFDPLDVALLRQWWEVGRAASAQRPVDLWTPWEQAEISWTLPPVDREIRTFGAFDETGGGAEMVGAARLALPEKDNTHLAFVEVYVRPDRAREGIGRALTLDLERAAAERGRTTLLAAAYEEPGADGVSSAFADALGFPQVSEEEIKSVDLLATEARWQSLAAEASEHTVGYELVWWADAVPDTYLDDMLVLLTRFLDETPLEGMDLNAQQWDESKLRRSEAHRHNSGYQWLDVAALAPNGHLVGYTDVFRSGSSPHWAGIDGTLVVPGHRGHRLGLAMKVRLHELVRETWPDCRTIVTGNAGVNAHMNAVNDRLGYSVVEVECGVQKVLAS